NLTADSCCVGVTVLPEKYAFCKTLRSALMPHSATSLAARSNWALPGCLRKCWPVCRNPISLSLNRTGTAVSHSPTGQVTVHGSWVAFSQSRSCTCRQAAHARLFSDTSTQNGFSLGLPWCGNCQVSTGCNAIGSPVKLVNACS